MSLQVLRRARKITHGWIRTIFINAPPSMEHVETIFREIADGSELANLCQLLSLARIKGPAKNEFQLPKDGVGEVIYRRYRLTLQCDLSAKELIAKVQAVPDRFCDSRLAKFEKSRGCDGEMVAGDRFDIAISGPWDGPVETIEVNERSFTFVTLKGHLEAGFIRFSADDELGIKTFRIESWASSAGPLVWLSYSGLGAAKKMQTKMWRHFCLKLASVVSANVVGPFEITTISLGKVNAFVELGGSDG